MQLVRCRAVGKSVKKRSKWEILLVPALRSLNVKRTTSSCSSTHAAAPSTFDVFDVASWRRISGLTLRLVATASTKIHCASTETLCHVSLRRLTLMTPSSKIKNRRSGYCDVLSRLLSFVENILRNASAMIP